MLKKTILETILLHSNEGWIFDYQCEMTIIEPVYKQMDIGSFKKDFASKLFHYK